MPILEPELFDRLILRALRDFPGFVKDDLAGVMEATRQSLRDENSSLHLAFSNASALRLLHQGGVFLNDHDALKTLLPHLAVIESDLLKSKRLTSSALLALTLKWLKEQNQLPPMIDDGREIILERAIDLSEAQLQIIFRLAELSKKITFRLLFDRKERGLLSPVQALLSRLELLGTTLPIVIELSEPDVAAPIQTFFDALFDNANEFDARKSGVRAVLTSQFSSQVSWVCERIETIRQKSRKDSIAIVFRNLDKRMHFIDEALAAKKIPFRISSRLAVNEISQVRTLLRRVEDFPKTQKRTISSYLYEAAKLVNEEKISQYLEYFAEGLKEEERKISALSFTHWLKGLFERREVVCRPDENADAVELVSVKQIGSKKFDHVFLVDLAQGRFPKTDEGSVPFSDSERHQINGLLSRPILQVFYEDPLETSQLPARLGFESLWLVDVICSARKGLYLSSSVADPSGREQGLSEFLASAMKLVNERYLPAPRPLLQPRSIEMIRHCERSEAIHVFDSTKNTGLPRCARNDENQSLQSTMAAVTKIDKRSENTISPGCSIDKVESKRVFQRWLGLDPSRPLTPTRLEAFASCPFRALVEKIFSVEDADRSTDDVDARRVGQFVHTVLEKFFRSHEEENLQKEGLSPRSRERLLNLIEENKEILSEGEGKTSALIIKANLLWVTLILERAISNLLNSPPIADVAPLYFEKGLGFSEPKCEIKVGEDSIFLGGILDRIDKGRDAYVIVDYKLSSALSIRKKISAKENLKTHFQLPVYAKLLMNTFDDANQKSLFAYLVSIRDGVVSDIFGKDIILDLKELVQNRESEDGLEIAIGKVMAPILEGHFPAKSNPSCDYCHVKSVCRIKNDAIEIHEDE